MTDKSFEIIFEAQTDTDVAIFKQVLEEAGIKVIVQPAGETWQRVYFGAPIGPTTAYLLVPSDKAEQARQLLADFQADVEGGALELEGDEAI